ncbi:MAG TPA: HPr(Ser) kinase/phosphatase [Erysipelothrix sp.]|jgi:HPr kinase/phosphorylase|nr:HPr(Ser) kinase/phosphatase [Erysipelothrix sp.]
MTNTDIKCPIRDLKDHFDFQQITGNEQSLDRWIIVPDVNRPGLELAGFYDHTEPRRVVVLGHKEMAYIKQLTDELQWERFDLLLDGWTPAIVIAHGLDCPPILREVAIQKNFPIFISEKQTSEIMIDIITYLDEQLSPVEYVHGVLINVHGKGVLITGDSGMGKSEIALELIRSGHILIADDRVDVTRAHGQLIGQAPDLLAGMIEIRGIGIMNITSMFGASSTMSKSNIDFVIELEPWNDATDYLRAGIEPSEPYSILGLEVPKLIFPVREGRNMAMLVESAVTDFTLKSRGFDSSKEFEQKVYNLLLEKSSQ